MARFRSGDYIVVHEDWQHRPFWDFIAEHYYKLVNPPRLPLPSADAVRGSLPAEVNQGRWIVDCPVEGCGGAVLVSKRTPIFLCPYCGNPENEGHWYEVRFPAEHEAIEAALLKRPATHPWLAYRRNWKPGESLADLERENRERGIE